MRSVHALRAKVVNGRLVVDEPTSLPDGTEIDLAVLDPGDELDEQERAALHAALADAWRSARSGQTSDAQSLFEKLRPRG
jgi:hypothetical protein